MVAYQQVNVLFIGSFKVYLYSLMAIIAIIMALIVLVCESKRYKLEIKKGLWLVFWALLGIYFGARLFYTVGPWHAEDISLGKRLAITFMPWSTTGLVMYGGLIFGIIFGAAYAYLKKLSFWTYADIAALGGAIGMLFGRFGCYFANCCPTKATAMPWAIVLNGKGYHPSSIYENIFFILLFIALLKIREHKRFEGQLFLTFLVSYPIVRFLVEFTRYYPDMYFGLTASQIISIALFAIFLPVYIRKSKEKTESIPGPKQALSTYLILLAAGAVLTFSVYMVSAWNMIYSFSFFNLGLLMLLFGMARAFDINIKGVFHSKNVLFKNLLVIFVTLVLLFSLSGIIQRVIGSYRDTPRLRTCPYETAGNTSSEIRIIYLSSPYCTVCWQEELFVFPELFKELNSSFFMEKYDIRFCKNVSKEYGIYGTPGFVISNLKAEKEYIYYGYRSLEQFREDIGALKGR